MKLAILGTVVLAGAVAFAQSTSPSQGSSSTYPSSNSSTTQSAYPNSNGSATQSTYPSSPNSATQGAYGESGSSETTSPIANGPVAEVVSDSSAVIGWATKAPGEMTVKYGKDRENLNETAEATRNADGKNHHAKLTGLSPKSTYYFQVMDNGEPVGGIGTFKTVGRGEAAVKSKATIPE